MYLTAHLGRGIGGLRHVPLTTGWRDAGHSETAYQEPGASSYQKCACYVKKPFNRIRHKARQSF